MRARAAASRQALRRALLLHLAVAAGATIGGVGRALVSLLPLGAGAGAFPWATLIVNAGGSFLIGFYATLTEPGGRLMAGSRARHFVMTGVCGGFTTFSVFSLESFRLLAAGAQGLAAANVAASVAAWMASVFLGAAAGHRLNRLPRRRLQREERR